MRLRFISSCLKYYCKIEEYQRLENAYSEFLDIDLLCRALEARNSEREYSGSKSEIIMEIIRELHNEYLRTKIREDLMQYEQERYNLVIKILEICQYMESRGRYSKEKLRKVSEGNSENVFDFENIRVNIDGFDSMGQVEKYFEDFGKEIMELRDEYSLDSALSLLLQSLYLVTLSIETGRVDIDLEMLNRISKRIGECYKYISSNLDAKTIMVNEREPLIYVYMTKIDNILNQSEF